jgi:hypothetical protein
MKLKLKVSKQCSSCGRTKLLKDFNLKKNNKDKKNSECKMCSRNRDYFNAHKDGNRNPFDDLSGGKQHFFSEEEREKAAREALTELTE